MSGRRAMSLSHRLAAAALPAIGLLAACAGGERSARPAPAGAGGGQAAAVVTLGPEPTQQSVTITLRPPRTPTPADTATVTPSPTATVEPTALATAGATVSAESPGTVTAEEYAILSAVLRAGYVAPGQRRLVIQGSTVAPALRAGQATALEASSSPELVADFRARNEQSAALADKLSLPLPYTLARRADLDRLTTDPGWTAFNRQYVRANGYVIVSRVGFDPTGEQAMVSVVQRMGAGVERATLYVLSRTDGRWEIVDAVSLAVS